MATVDMHRTVDQPSVARVISATTVDRGPLEEIVENLKSMLQRYTGVPEKIDAASSVARQDRSASEIVRRQLFTVTLGRALLADPKTRYLVWRESAAGFKELLRLAADPKADHSDITQPMLQKPSRGNNGKKNPRYLGGGGMGDVYALDGQMVGKVMRPKRGADEQTAEARFEREFLSQQRITADREERLRGIAQERKALLERYLPQPTQNGKLQAPSVPDNPVLQSALVDLRSREEDTYVAPAPLAAGVLANGEKFIAMQRIGGEDLQELLDREGYLSIEDAAAYLRSLLVQIAQCHRLGLVHRDLKLQNIMVPPTKTGKKTVVMDFGLGRAFDKHDKTLDVLEATMTADGAILGTPAFMAPDQALPGRVPGEKRPRPADDLYSLAVIFVRMVTGRNPREFEAESLLAMLHAIAEERSDPSKLHGELGDYGPNVQEVARALISGRATDDELRAAAAVALGVPSLDEKISVFQLAEEHPHVTQALAQAEMAAASRAVATTLNLLHELEHNKIPLTTRWKYRAIRGWKSVKKFASGVRKAPGNLWRRAKKAPVKYAAGGLAVLGGLVAGGAGIHKALEKTQTTEFSFPLNEKNAADMAFRRLGSDGLLRDLHIPCGFEMTQGGIVVVTAGAVNREELYGFAERQMDEDTRKLSTNKVPVWRFTRKDPNTNEDVSYVRIDDGQHFIIRGTRIKAFTTQKHHDMSPFIQSFRSNWALNTRLEADEDFRFIVQNLEPEQLKGSLYREQVLQGSFIGARDQSMWSLIGQNIARKMKEAVASANVQTMLRPDQKDFDLAALQLDAPHKQLCTDELRQVLRAHVTTMDRVPDTRVDPQLAPVDGTLDQPPIGDGSHVVVLAPEDIRRHADQGKEGA